MSIASGETSTTVDNSGDLHKLGRVHLDGNGVAVPARPSATNPLVVDAVAGPGDGTTAYLGFGISTRSSLGTGELPLDALSMMLVASDPRYGRHGVVHLIADTHALVNSFVGAREANSAAARLAEEVRRLADLFGLTNYLVVRASEIEDPLHAALRAETLSRCSEPYAALQAADVEWAVKRRGASVKVGWTASKVATDPPTGFDERYFDGVHRELFSPIGAVYVAPGRCLDFTRPRCSPYTMVAGQQRLTVRSNRAEIAAHCASRSMRRHLTPLCDHALARLGVECAPPLSNRLAVLLERLAVDRVPASTTQGVK